MRKHHRRPLAAAMVAAAATAATIAVTAVTAASATPRTLPAVSGTEHVQVMSTSTTSSTASAIARGVFTAAGTAKLGSARGATIAFTGGTIKLRHRAAKGTMHFSPRTCLTRISQPGTYKITGGTGKYAGISGHGTYQLSLTFIASRTRGKCSMATPPAARQELLRLSGPVHL
jgi:creatinine amidohydrolase/Fe(II)-dependent formamide hydrolase-like protein